MEYKTRVAVFVNRWGLFFPELPQIEPAFFFQNPSEEMRRDALLSGLEKRYRRAGLIIPEPNRFRNNSGTVLIDAVTQGRILLNNVMVTNSLKPSDLEYLLHCSSEEIQYLLDFRRNVKIEKIESALRCLNLSIRVVIDSYGEIPNGSSFKTPTKYDGDLEVKTINAEKKTHPNIGVNQVKTLKPFVKAVFLNENPVEKIEDYTPDDIFSYQTNPSADNAWLTNLLQEVYEGYVIDRDGGKHTFKVWLSCVHEEYFGYTSFRIPGEDSRVLGTEHKVYSYAEFEEPFELSEYLDASYLLLEYLNNRSQNYTLNIVETEEEIPAKIFAKEWADRIKAEVLRQKRFYYERN